MKLKQFIFALVAMLSFSFSAFAQSTVSTEADLQAALNGGGEVTLGASITVSAPVTIPNDAEVVLNLNGKTLKAANAKTKVLENSGKLTINGQGTVSGIIYNGTANGSAAEMTLNGGTYSLDGNSGGLHHYGKTLTINDGVVVNTTSYGVRVQSKNSVLNLYGGTFTATTAGDMCRPFAISKGTVNFLDKDITVNGYMHVMVGECTINFGDNNENSPFEAYHQGNSYASSVFYCKTLAEAIKRTDFAAVTLVKNVKVAADAPITVNKEINLNLNGKNLSATNAKTTVLKNYANLTIKGKGTVTGLVYNGDAENKGVAEMTLNGGTYKLDGANGGFFNYGKTLTVNDGVTISSAVYGLRMSNAASVINLNGGTFTSTNLTDNMKRAIAVDAGTINFNDDDITINGYLHANRSKAKVNFGEYCPFDAFMYSTTNASGYYVVNLENAIDKADAGYEIVLQKNLERSEIVTLPKKVTLDGNGKTLTSAAGRAINVDCADAVTIENLTIAGATGCERGINIINKAGTTNIKKVNVSGVSHYAVHVATSAGAAQVNIENSNLTGWAAIATYGEGGTIDVKNSNLVGIGNATDNTSNDFATIAAASNITVNVTGGKVIAERKEGKAPQAIVCGNSTPTSGVKFVLDTELELINAEYINHDLGLDNNTVAVREAYSRDYVTTPADNGLVNLTSASEAEVDGVKHAKLEAAFAAATEGQTITLIADVTPSLTSQRAITKAAVVDLGGKTLTLTEDDLYFGTTTFKNGTIVVAPSVKASTAVFWMFENQTLTFDNVDIVATGVTGTYLIGINGGTGTAVNLLNGSSITINNDATTALTAVICDNGTGNNVTIKDSEIDVKNIEGRFYLGGKNGVAVVENTNVDLNGVKEGFYLRAGQSLDIAGTSSVSVVLNSTEGRYGINLTDVNAVYTKGENATVNATVYEVPAAAKIGNFKYTTLQAAINAVKNGETIYLVNNLKENVTVSQVEGVSFVIDGDGKEFDGTITLDGNSRNPAAETLTIQNVDFVTSVASHYFIEANDASADNRYSHNVTIKDCNFTATAGSAASQTAVAARFRQAFNIKIEGGVFTNLHSVLQAYGCIGIEVTGVKTVDCKNGVSFGTSTGAVLNDVEFDATGYGVRADAETNTTLTINDAKINAFIPVVVRKASADYNVVLNGDNEFTATNEDQLWCAIGTSEYEANGTMPSAATGKVRVTLNDEGLTEEGVYGAYVPVAIIGDTEYTTLEAAFKAATNGCTISIVHDVTVDYAWDCRNTGSKFMVPVTINGNGKTIKFTNTVYDGGNYLSAFRFEADATVNNLVVDMSEAQSGFAGRFRAISSKGNLTVDGCTFIGNGSENNTRAIIFGEGAGANSENLVISIKNNKFIGWKRGITDNENAQDVKSVTISGNTLENAAVYVSAKENVVFNNNTTDADVIITSYNNREIVAVEANGNTLNAEKKNSINVNPANVNAQEDFLLPSVAMVGETPYASLEAAAGAAQDGDVIILNENVTLSETLTLPAGITFNGNGKQINGAITAGGDLTFAGHTKVTNFSAGYYDRVITIGEGACLEVTGGRMTVSYGNVFNITGSVADAKEADKANVQPSLIVEPGLSFNGDGRGVQFNVTNAYVKLGDSSSKNSGATGEFNFNFNNSIVEFTKTLKTYEPTVSGLAPEFEFNAVNSVVTFASHLELWRTNNNFVLNNTDLTVGGSFANAGGITVENGANFVVNAPIMSSHGGNTGTINVLGGTFELKDSNQDWENAGTMKVAVNGKIITNDFKCVGEGKILVDATDIPENTDVKVVDGNGVYNFQNVTTVEGPVVATSFADGDVVIFKTYAKIGDTYYKSLKAAIDAVQNGETIEMVDDCSEVVNINKSNVAFTIDGAQKTYTGKIEINIGQNVTVKNLNFVHEADEATDFIANVGSPTGKNYNTTLLVDGCSFTGNGKDNVVAVRTIHPTLVTIQNSNGKGLHSMLQNTGGQVVVVDGVTVTESNGGLAIGSPNGQVTVKNSNLTTATYGVRLDANNTNAPGAILENNKINAYIPVSVRKASATNYKLTFNGNESAYTATNNDGKWCAICTTEYEQGVALNEPTGKVKVVVNSDLPQSGLYGNHVEGSLTAAYTNADGYWGECGGNANYSFELKFFNGETFMGTTSLQDVDNIINGDVNVTWNLKFDAASNTDDYWKMSWDVAPSVTMQPNRVEQWVDGVKVAECAIQLNGPDNLYSITTAVVDESGKIVKCYPTLEAAVAAGNNVAILKAGTYALKVKDGITITGAVDGVEFANIGAFGCNGASVTFNNVTFTYAENSMYKGLQHSGDLVYNNCTFNGQVFLYGNSETFNNCTFNTTDAANYNVWTYGAKNVAFNGCTFNSAGKSVLIYAEGASVFNNVTVTDCTFEASQPVEGKAAIELDSSLTAGANLTITNSTATNFGTGNVSGNSLWNNKKGNANAANNDITIVVDGNSVLAPVYDAKIGDEQYRTLQDAVNAVQDGDIITMLLDVTANVTLTEKVGLYYTIDGNGKTMNGTITVKALSDTEDNRRITIKNINFVADAKCDFITSTETNHYPRLTVEGCSFTGTQANDCVAIRLKSAYGAVIKNCTGKNLHSFLQNTSGVNLTIDGVTVTDSKSGLALGTVQGVTVKNCNITASEVGYGIRLDANTYNNNAVIAGNTVSAFIPVVVRELNANGNITIGEGNEFTATNTDDKWMVIGKEEYETNGALPAEVAGANVVVALNDANLSYTGIHGAGLAGKGTEAEPYLINNATELQMFRDKVNAGATKYSKPGVWVALNADINLAGINWVGIGSMTADHGFMGNFDGKGFKIQNLTIENPALDSDGYAYAGFFALTEGTDKDNQNVVKNLTIENVTIKTDGHIAAAAIAYAYYTNVDNVKVCGNIAIEGGDYTAGVLAYTRRCVNASNLAVEGNDGSYIKGAKTVGGVISDIQMNGGLKAEYSNFSAQGVTVSGKKNVGGISGIIATQTLNGASVKNITLNSEDARVGIVAGALGGTSTVSNVTYESVTGATALLGATFDEAKTVEARIGDTYYATFAAAYTAAQAGETVTMLADLTIAESLAIDKSIAIDGNGRTLTYTGSGASARAITVENTAQGVELAISNLTVDCTASYCQRGINYNTNGKLTLDNVTVKGTNVTYALNLPGSADNAEVTIVNSNLTGNIALNVWGENSTVNVENTTLTAVDNSTAEGYAAVKLNNDGTTAAEGTVINITGGVIDVTGTACEDTEAVSNATSTGEINISDTVVNGEVTTIVAVIRYNNGYSYSFQTLEAAIEYAKAGETVTLVRDVTASAIVTIDKAITLDGNGKKLTSTATGTTARAINVSGADGVTIKNLTIDAKGERAINVIQGATNVTIENVIATAANYTVNVAGSAANAVVAINKSELTGLNIVNVAAPGAQVTVNETVLNCADHNDSEKYAALALNKDAKNGSIVATNVTFNIEGDSRKATNQAENGTVTIDGSTEGVEVHVAYISYGNNWYGFATLEKAIEKANAGETIELIADVTTANKIVINKSIALDGNGKTLTYTGTDRAIDVPNDANAVVNVTIKDLNVVATTANRGLNYNDNGEFNVEGVTVTIGENVDGYAINFPGMADGAKVTIKNSKLTSRNPLNIWGENMVINVYDSEIISVDNSTTYDYAAIQLNNDLYGNVANGTVVNVYGGTITATNEEGEPSNAVANSTETGVVNISDETVISGEVANYVANIGGAYFTSLQAAVNAIEKHGYNSPIVLMKSFSTSEATTIKSGLKVTIDLNGKTITGTDTGTASYGLININPEAELTINDATGNGAIKLTATNNRGWNAYSSVISNQRGKLTVNGGTIEHLGGTDMAYAIDILTNTGAQNAEAVINGGTVKSTYRAIRQFLNSAKAQNILTVNGGTIEGGNKSIWMQDANASANPGALTVGATAKLTGDVYLYVTAGSTAWPVEVSIAAAALQGESKVTTGNVPAGYDLALVDGVYGVYSGAAKIGTTYYETVDAAIKAAKAGETVNILAGTYPVPSMKAGITVEGAVNADGTPAVLLEGTLSGTLDNLTLKNLHIKGGNAQRWAYAKGDLVFENVIFEATSVYALHFDGIAAGTNLTYKNCTIIGWAAMGGSPASCVFDGCTIKGNGTYGLIRTYFDAEIKDCTFDVSNVNTNDVYQDGIHAVDGAEVVVNGCTNENGTMKDLVNVHASSVVTVDGTVYKNVAKVADKNYITIEDAFAAWADGTTLTLLTDIALDTKTLVTECDGYASIVNVEGKAITIDLNGKTITVNAAAADLANAKSKMLMAVFSVDEDGKLTIDDSSEDKTGAVNVSANGATVYSLAAAYGEGAKLTINNGSYCIDEMFGATSLIYAQHSECVIINGGTYNVGNVGTGANGSPWIFNTKGQNMDGIYVYGGTYPTDINHQFWFNEAIVPGHLAVKANEDGTWSVVEAAAYTREVGRSTGSWRRNVGYATIEEAIAATQMYNCEGNVVTLAKNVEIEQMITVANGVEVTLDLNGKTLAATDNTSKNYSAIDNRGDLTIVDSSEDETGKITVTATVNSGWNRYSAVIANNPGGELTVMSGTIEHLGGTDMAYGIDNLTNGKGTYAETIINGGIVKSPYRAVRQFLNGVEAQNILTINGGDIQGANKSIFFHDPSKNANNGTLYVAEDATLNGDVYLFVTAGSTEWPVEVYVDKDALGENEILPANIPEYAAALVEYDTFWQVEQKNLAELTIEDDCAEYINKIKKNVGVLTYERYFDDTEWQTIVLPFDVPVANLTEQFEVAYIYNASYKATEKGKQATIDFVIIEDAEFVLAANYPYMIRAKETGWNNIVVEDAKLMPTEAEILDCSSIFEKFSFIGNYATVDADDLDATMGYFNLTSGAWSKMDVVNPFRFYMQIKLRNGDAFEYPSEAQPIRMRSVNANGEETTGINGVDAEQAGDFIFDIHGRRVLETEKGGIYIKGGKKFIAQ